LLRIPELGYSLPQEMAFLLEPPQGWWCLHEAHRAWWRC